MPFAAPTRNVRTIHRTLPSHKHSPQAARKRVEQMGRGLSAATVATAQLLVSELVTNAVVHGPGPVGLRISRDHRMLRVEVSDGADTPHPTPQQESDAEAGRGLFLLSALATTWGTTPANRHGPKTTWFELT